MKKIYMEQSEGFIVKGQEHKVCNMVKFLYGLKQAPKQQHEKFDSVKIKDGFTINKCDKCVYTETVGDACIIVCLYVNDMLILETTMEVIKSTNNFDMKNLTVADVILGIKIIRTPYGISLSQSHYVKKMIERFKEHGIRQNTNSFLPHIHLHKNT